mmetsp:Transcript_9910/g.25498  ORF Transcript_9910/g.25498 Transcript_9910/m.25498 type:complete len:232 (-) Transcript_9910:984-1679(-)
MPPKSIIDGVARTAFAIFSAPSPMILFLVTLTSSRLVIFVNASASLAPASAWILLFVRFTVTKLGILAKASASLIPTSPSIWLLQSSLLPRLSAEIRVDGSTSSSLITALVSLPLWVSLLLAKLSDEIWVSGSASASLITTLTSFKAPPDRSFSARFRTSICVDASASISLVSPDSPKRLPEMLTSRKLGIFANASASASSALLMLLFARLRLVTLLFGSTLQSAVIAWSE